LELGVVSGILSVKQNPTELLHTGRVKVLDGWRALSIILVLCAHLLPLNVFWPTANDAAGVAGMAIFFTLSGFLITRFLLDRPDPRSFLIRRLLRIVPLAWSTMLILYIWNIENTPTFAFLANILFFSNLPPQHLLVGGGHLWSLCVEMQFYVVTAFMIAVAGQRALRLLPFFALLITGLRISSEAHVNIVTWLRADEIYAGATVALIYSGVFGKRAADWLSGLNFYVVTLFAISTCVWSESPLGYARPYAIATMVGVTLWHIPSWLENIFSSKPALYIAETSYALYVIHGVLTATWLGSGELLEKYLKRPLLIIATFSLAHFSTFYFEKRFIQLGRWLTRKV
jgi:peptidoglycan/LPS O-acetylase OafA/YrhL